MFGDAALPVERWARRGLTAAAVVALIPLMGCEPKGNFGRPTAGAACPRPQAIIGAQQFNAQEQEIRALRQQAFAGDFFAQLDLARRYSGRDARENNLEDAVEAAVWYEMALANPDGYAPIIGNPDGRRHRDRFEDCREAERHAAYRALDYLLGRMSTDERQAVRDRVIYVLSTQGANGFRTLARLHDTSFGPFGDPVDQSPIDERDLAQISPPPAATLFPRNDVDVYLYNYLAAQAGDVAGYVMLKEFERSEDKRAGMGSFAEAKARRWTPPFEFYPPKAPESGVPHSDESRMYLETEGLALARIDELPFIHVGEALAYLRVLDRPAKTKAELIPQEIMAFQAMLGRPQTGRLTSLEEVRAIQYAAVNGSPKAQLALAVMYSEGVGVRRDYARAFYWYAEADRQGNPEAKYAMSTFFSLGVAGVADQDKAAAVVYQIDAALAGFKPSAQRLRELLAQVARAPKGSERNIR